MGFLEKVSQKWKQSKELTKMLIVDNNCVTASFGEAILLLLQSQWL